MLYNKHRCVHSNDSDQGPGCYLSTIFFNGIEFAKMILEIEADPPGSPFRDGEIHGSGTANRISDVKRSARLQASSSLEDLADEPYRSQSGCHCPDNGSDNPYLTLAIEGDSDEAEHHEKGRKTMQGERTKTPIRIGVSGITSDTTIHADIGAGIAANKLQHEFYQNEKTANDGTAQEEHLQPVKV